MEGHTPNLVIQWLGVRGPHQRPISGSVPYDTDREASHMFASYPVLLPDRPLNWTTRSEATLQAN